MRNANGSINTPDRLGLPCAASHFSLLKAAGCNGLKLFLRNCWESWPFHPPRLANRFVGYDPNTVDGFLCIDKTLKDNDGFAPIRRRRVYS